MITKRGARHVKSRNLLIVPDIPRLSAAAPDLPNLQVDWSATTSNAGCGLD